MTAAPATTSQVRNPAARPTTKFKRHDELADVAVPGGIRDQMPIAAVLELLPSLPGTPGPNRGKRSGRVDAAQIILEWLSTHGPQYRHRADEAVTVPTIDHIRICKLDDAAVGRFSDQQHRTGQVDYGLSLIHI